VADDAKALPDGRCPALGIRFAPTVKNAIRLPDAYNFPSQDAAHFSPRKINEEISVMPLMKPLFAEKCWD